METNYFGAVGLTRALLPSMLAREQGQIVNISSLQVTSKTGVCQLLMKHTVPFSQGLFAVPFRAAYGASKHALNAFSDSLRAEVTSRGVGVTVVNPGYVQTAISMNALTGDGQRFGCKCNNVQGGY